MSIYIARYIWIRVNSSRSVSLSNSRAKIAVLTVGLNRIVDFIIRLNKNNWNYYSAEYEQNTNS